MKKNSKNVLLLLGCVLMYAGMLISLLMPLRAIKQILELSDTAVTWIAIFLALILFVPFIIFAYKTQKGRIIPSWIARNFHKICIGFFAIVSCLSSLLNKQIWTVDEIKDVISVEWTIFGLSVTILLVWNGIILYYKSKQPHNTESQDLIQRSRLVIEKSLFSMEVRSSFISVVFLSISLLLLFVSSESVYIQLTPESLLTQCIVKCNFFFSGYSLFLLFIDILKPFWQDMKELLQPNQITDNAFIKAQNVLSLKRKISEILDGMNGSDKLTDEQKSALISKCIEELLNESPWSEQKD